MISPHRTITAMHMTTTKPIAKIQQIIATIQKILKTNERAGRGPIALHEPYFAGNEWNYVKECLDTGWVSYLGTYVDRFEADLAAFTGAQYAIATVNGTAALHICYQLAGIKAQDEVLVPTVTFVGTINPITYCGAIPHFIDSEKNFLGIDVSVLDQYLHAHTVQQNKICMNRMTQRPIRALCVVHTLGHPVDLDAVADLCEKYHLVLIEDAAEALGSYYKGTHVGHRGLLGVLSFNGNKIISTGGGGAILTNNKELAMRAKHLTTTAKKPHPWLFEHDEIAYNYRMPNLNAALGCAQLEKIADFLKAKRLLAEKYQEAFKAFDVSVLREPDYAFSNYWLNAFILDQSLIEYRDEIIKLLMEQGIMARGLWNLQHTLTMFEHCPRMPLPVALDVSKRFIKLPSSARLGFELNNNH